MISLLSSKPHNLFVATIYYIYKLFPSMNVPQKSKLPYLLGIHFFGREQPKKCKHTFRPENIGQICSPTTQSILGVWGKSAANRKARYLSFSTMHLSQN